MRVKILQDCHIPNIAGFIAGEEVVVEEAIGAILVERGHAEEVKTVETTKKHNSSTKKE